MHAMNFHTPAGTTAVRYSTTFWDCRLNQMEKWVLPICICITMLLQVKAVLYSALALP